MRGKSKLNMTFLRDNQPGIWAYSSYLTPLPDQFKLSLNEGQTKEIELAENLILKREDENPTGSWKDRGMAFLVSQAFSVGEKNLVLSSSGNAALSAREYCQLAGLKLYLFISPKMPPAKRDLLKGVEIFETLRPVSEAVKFAKKNDFFNLRPSLNRFGPEGYQTIAFEILEHQGLISDLFLPVSSGAGLLGLAYGFQKFGHLPRIHLCQSAAVCPLARFFDQDYQLAEKSLATALVARYTPLKDRILKIIKESSGTGWVISNEEILLAEERLKEKGIVTSAEGALALAAVEKARKNNFSLGKTIVLLTGRRYETF